MSVQVESIKLKVGKRELTLSVKDAEELRKALNELFEKEVKYIPTRFPYGWREVPYTRWPEPMWVSSTGTNIELLTNETKGNNHATTLLECSDST